MKPRTVRFRSLLALLLLSASVPGLAAAVNKAGIRTTARAAVPRLPASAYLGSVGFSPQTYNNCGPASVSAVLSAYGLQVSQQTIASAIKPGSGYMTSEVIAPFLAQYGLQAVRYKQGTLNHIRALLASGIPVIMLQWLNTPGRIPHFRVARGYDDRAGVMWFSDPYYGANTYVSYTDFERLWGTLYQREFIPVVPQGRTDLIVRALTRAL